MTLDTRDLEVESERVYVVYDGKTGAIAHVHRIVTHRGATPTSDRQGEARALELATRFGHRANVLRVLRAENFDTGVPQRVNIKTLEILAVKPVDSRRPATRTAGRGQKVGRRRAGLRR